MARFVLTLVLGLIGGFQFPATAQRPPIIDVHVHAYGPAQFRTAAPNPVTQKPSPASAEEHMKQTLAVMDQYNIVKAIVSGPLDNVEEWRKASTDRVVGSPLFGRAKVDFYGRAFPSMNVLRGMFKSGRLAAIGEMLTQYEGVTPSDPSFEPWLDLAEQMDIPVGIHTGSSFPGTPYNGYPRFRVALGNPLLIEDVLVRHPKLRVFLAHGGEPWRRETVALMQMYEQVHVDTGAFWLFAARDRAAVDDWFREMIGHGFGKRIMFGSDQMRWPEAIGMAIDIVESSKVLTEDQKRDILYNNAARFLKIAQ